MVKRVVLMATASAYAAPQNNISNTFTSSDEPLETYRVLVALVNGKRWSARSELVVALAQWWRAVGGHVTASHQLDLHQRR